MRRGKPALSVANVFSHYVLLADLSFARVVLHNNSVYYEQAFKNIKIIFGLPSSRSGVTSCSLLPTMTLLSRHANVKITFTSRLLIPLSNWSSLWSIPSNDRSSSSSTSPFFFRPAVRKPFISGTWNRWKTEQMLRWGEEVGRDSSVFPICTNTFNFPWPNCDLIYQRGSFKFIDLRLLQSNHCATNQILLLNELYCIFCQK